MKDFVLFAVHMADEITGASNLLPFKVVADDSQTVYTLSSSGDRFECEVLLPSYVCEWFASMSRMCCTQ